MLLEATNSSNSSHPPLSSTLIAFKPRQVLLAQHRTVIMKQTKSLEPHQKTLILHSVLRYVEKCGFFKTLKRFLSEAQIEDDNWKASSVDLEDIFCEYSEKCTGDGNLNICKEQELQTDDNNKISGSVKAGAASEESTKKKKKKKSDESDVKAGEDKSDPLEKNEDDTVSNVSSKKPKDKKKNKSIPVTESPLAVGGEEKSEPNNVDDNSTPKVDVETKDEKKKKKKEKKKNKASIDSPSLEDAPDNPLEEKKVKAKDKKETKVHDSVTKEPLDETLKKDKKSSKRKRLTETEIKNEPLNEEEIKEEEPKRRKTEAIEEVQAAKSEDQLTNGDGHKPSEDQPNEYENGKLDNNEGKSARKKSAIKQINGSAEPKTVKAFQRVKIDEVKFADEKLQDNSYWAKDGADIGYGAKAQEVLGQVRGRDFRHEKTKKKRGSYRGGQIDLDSHSIKFNYSDED